MFNFTPLLGARAASPAVQSLLEFDGGIRILIDVGWDVSFDAEALKELERVQLKEGSMRLLQPTSLRAHLLTRLALVRQVPTISIVLLTHATVSHVGAYAHCCKHIPLFSKIPVYATAPVIALSRTLLQDLYASTSLASSFLSTSALSESAYAYSQPLVENPNILLPIPTHEEIKGYFAIANQLKYLQPHQPLPSPLSPPLDGLIITAYCAGHTLGGTIWHIQYGSESIVYAVDWHQARENVFPGAAWLSAATGAQVIEQLRQPSALICSSKVPSIDAAGGRQMRDERLISKIRSTIEEGGDILIPCDTSARVLELAYVLDRAWSANNTSESQDNLRTAKLFVANSTSSATVRYARSMLEWMDESVIRDFEAAQQGKMGTSQPFDFQHVKLLERRSQLDRALQITGPKVILASDASLEWGFAREMLADFVSKPRNLVILTDAISQTTTVACMFWDILRQKLGDQEAANGIVNLKNVTVETRKFETSPLAGNDLSTYQQYLARQRQRQDMTQTDKGTALETSADVVDDGSSDSSSSDGSDDEHQGKALNVTAALTNSKHKLGLTDEELGVHVVLRRKNVYDYDVRGRKGKDKMFPFVVKRKRNDEFGDLIRPEDYLRAEERDELDGQDISLDITRADTALGRKRKWGNAEDGRDDGKKKTMKGTYRQRRRNEAPDAAAETDQGNAGNASQEAENDSESDYEPAEATNRGPMKAIFSKESFTLNMKLTAVDYSGIHDQRSLQMLIPLIRPRKLILTAGTEAATTFLAEVCKKLLGPSTEAYRGDGVDVVFAPVTGQLVDASVDTNAWAIKLSQSFFRRLQWQSFRGLGIVNVNGRLEPTVDEDPNGTEAKRQKTVHENEAAAETDFQAAEHTDLPMARTSPLPSARIPVLSVIPSSMSLASRPTTQPLHVGDLRLAELRKIMQANGHTAEFKGEGTLLIDGSIAVRKSGIGRIIVESGGLGATARHLGTSFYDVKKKIYEGLAVVAAR